MSEPIEELNCAEKLDVILKEILSDPTTFYGDKIECQSMPYFAEDVILKNPPKDLKEFWGKYDKN